MWNCFESNTLYNLYNGQSKVYKMQGRPQDLGGGGPIIYFSDLGICMSRSDMLRMAKPCALLGGFGGMPPPRKFFKTVQFGAF